MVRPHLWRFPRGYHSTVSDARSILPRGSNTQPRNSFSWSVSWFQTVACKCRLCTTSNGIRYSSYDSVGCISNSGRHTINIQGDSVARGPKLLSINNYVTETMTWKFIYTYRERCGLGSSVGIATELWAGRSGIESRWGRDFPPVQTGPGVHTASCKMGTGSFPGVLLTTHPLLVPRSWKSRAITLPTLWATPGL